MSTEKFEQVLEFGRNPTKALNSSPSALHDVLECVICNSLLISPYTLRCGHTFCGNCLALWFKERIHDASCPTCRDRVTSEPVPNLAIRQLAVAVLESWNADPENESIEIPYTEAPLPRGEVIFSGVRQRAPVYDNEDGVYRCPACDHEIEDGGLCSGCGLQFPDLDRDYTESSDDIYSDDDTSPATHNNSRWRHYHSDGSDDANSDEMDSDDMNFVVDDDDAEAYGSEPFEYSQTHRSSASSSDSDFNAHITGEDEIENSSGDDIEITTVRQAAPRPSHRTVVIDDDDSD